MSNQQQPTVINMQRRDYRLEVMRWDGGNTDDVRSAFPDAQIIPEGNFLRCDNSKSGRWVIGVGGWIGRRENGEHVAYSDDALNKKYKHIV